MKRPKCCLCGNLAQNSGRRSDNSIIWRKLSVPLAEELGMADLAGKAYVCGQCHRKTWHPYLKFRKSYCEDAGCTSTIKGTWQLDVHHVDGDPSNNNRINLITLCKCCHADLHYNNKELSQSPGRKALGIKY